MGRRSIKADKGEPGNYYFHEPFEQQILSKKPAPIFTPDVNSPVNLTSYRQMTNCRTISIRNSSISTRPEKVAYLLDEHPSLKEIDDYLALQSTEGFGEKAVVTRRWAPVDTMISPNHWGLILLEHRLPRGAAAKWAPYTVRWCMMGEIESTWAEDLVLIHPALDKEQLHDILEAQEALNE